jgi:hypothetical protein
MHAARSSPLFTIRALLGLLWCRTSPVLPRAIVRGVERIRGLPYPIPIGSIGFGDLRRLSPISRGFGCGRARQLIATMREISAAARLKLPITTIWFDLVGSE